MALTFILVSSGTAQAKKPTGQEIMHSVEHRDDGKDELATVTLEVKPKNGSKRLRRFNFLRKDYDDHKKIVTYFIAPLDVRNSAFLTWDMYDGSPDPRWLYLPAVGQIRRMSPGDERTSFFGSDFVFEDLTNRDPELDSHKLVGEEKVKEWDCWVVESRPKDGGVEFTTFKSWVWKVSPLLIKQEFYNDAGKPIRRGEIASLKKVQDIWTWHRGTMWNLETGSRSRLVLSDVKYDTGIPDTHFSQRQLRRGSP